MSKRREMVVEDEMFALLREAAGLPAYMAEAERRTIERCAKVADDHSSYGHVFANDRAKAIAHAIRSLTPLTDEAEAAPCGEHPKGENSRSEVEGRSPADAVPAEEQGGAHD